jgi:hypothetical protein
MEDNEDEGVSIDKGYEDKEDNEDDVVIIECALKQGESLEVVPSGKQFILGEVFEEDYVYIYKAIFPLGAFPPNPRWGPRLPPDPPAGG